MRYRTEQRELLSAYFAEHAASQFTAEELASALAPSIGTSTVYRLVGELVELGTVRRFQLGGRRVTYQYLGDGKCISHLHMKCVACGRMLHLDAHLSTFLQKQLLASSRFALDDQLTTLFGRCRSCLSEAEGGGR